jgi:para-aminobenzoate synthetase/4-amino-4-deoxychorismate lyase
MTAAKGVGTQTAELVVEPVLSNLSVREVALRMAEEPALVVLAGHWAGLGALIASAPTDLVTGEGDPFDLLDRPMPVAGLASGAVGGGWIGYLGYGVGRLVERLPLPPPSVTPLPRFVLGYYDHLLRYDSLSQLWWFEALVTPSRQDAISERRDHLLARLSAGLPRVRSFAVGGFVATPDRHDHEEAIARTVDHIGAGDIFQSNITMRLEAAFEGSPLELYLAGLENLEPPYGAFLGGDWGAIASMSPELFLRVRDRTVTTSPIKGTAPRGCDARTDGAARDGLVNSAKDRAENVMIVDLMRNDLGRVAITGTVCVNELCAVRPMAGVWHMVSTVTGRLDQEVTDGDLLRATFPPGSVTGAPKVRAMEIIAELEPTAREVYTGSVVLASPVIGLTASVAIRTFEIARGTIWVGVGGGIVADSTPAAEYDECLAKAQPLLRAIGAEAIGAGLGDGAGPNEHAPSQRPVIDASCGVIETMLAVDGLVVDPEAHLLRLARSTQALYGQSIVPTIGALFEAAQVVPIGRARMRISVCPDEMPPVSVSCDPFSTDESRSGLSLVPCTAPGGLGAHKWRDRSWLEQRSRAIGERILLLVDGDDVLECSRSSVFVIVGSVVLTPPTDGRILPGLARGRLVDMLLADGLVVREEPVTLRSMSTAAEVFVTNSLRGVEWVSACEGVGAWDAGPVAERARELFDEDRVTRLSLTSSGGIGRGGANQRSGSLDTGSPIS